VAAGSSAGASSPARANTQSDPDVTSLMSGGDVDRPAQGETGRAGGVSNTRLAQLAVESGMASQTAVRVCLDALARAHDEGVTKSLGDLMVEKGVLTQGQLHTLIEVARQGSGVNLLGGFQIIEKIGEGGMGAVYKAKQINLDRIVALKILPERLAANVEFLNRFLREAKIAAKLDHPNVVRAIDAGKAAGKFYFAMEFVEGKSLEKVLEEKGVLSEEEALAVIVQAARGLECAWRNQLVHRDIKPDNILLTKDGVAKLADLGLAKAAEAPGETRLTQDGAAMGTPHYISPEQAKGADVDTRSDIYSLGVTFYRAVTGQQPFTGKDPVSIIMARFHVRPKPANEVNRAVSDEVAQVIDTMMALDRNLRYPDPAVLLHDLELVAAGRRPEFASRSKTARERAIKAAQARRPTTVFEPVVVKRRRRAELVFIAAGSAAIAAMIAGSVALMRWNPAPPATVVYQAGQAAGELDPAAAAAEEARKALEKEAAEFHGELAAAFEAGRYAEVAERAKAAGAKYDATSAAAKIDLLRMQAAAKLEEAARLAREAAERDRQYADLVKLAREELAVRDYARAMDVLLRAKALKATDELDRLLAEAKRIQHAVRGEEAERSGRLDEALRLYDLALSAGPDEAVSSRRAEVRRRLELAEKLALAERALAGGDWAGARVALGAARELVRGDESAELRSRLDSAERRLSYGELVEKAISALRELRPRDALAAAEEAARLDPGAAEPRRLIIAARKAIGPDKELTNSIGMGFVLVPAGEFVMGSEHGDPDERPVRRVYVDAFYIGRYEVTNAQFEKFDPTHRRTEFSPGDDMPVVAVSWDDASAFCRWLSQKEGVEYRLPTEAEWEKAARGPAQVGPRKYPWGDGDPPPSGSVLANLGPGRNQDAWAADGHRFAAPVGSFPSGASVFGVHDMAGNVWEWCLDWYSADYYSKGAVRNPRGPTEGKWRVYRGGSFANDASAARCSNRAAQKADFTEASLGFRCVRALDRIFLEESEKP